MGDCFDFLQNNTLSRADLNGESGIARNVHYGDILIRYGDCLEDEAMSLPFVSNDEVAKKYRAAALHEGDIVFADTAEDEAAGKCVELLKLPVEPVIAGLHTIPARPRFSFGRGFLGHYLNSSAFHDQLLPLMQGIKVISVSKSALQDTTIRFPRTEEQAAIGRMLHCIDHLIALHQRKYDKLCTIKKSMLDKMFPRPGELVPEIRFEGFTDPWEQRKLENLASFGGGHTPSMADASNYVDGKILWVTSQDVKQHYIENTTTMISEKGAATLTLYPSDSIVIVARSGILRHTIPVAKLRKPATVNQDIKVIQTVDSCDSSWLLQYFIASNKTLLREYGKTGTTVESIDFAKMKSTALMVPYIEEQQAIGSFFSRLDNLITLHQRKLELLQDIKKSLLDKMFV